MDRRGQVAIDFLILLGVLLILISVVIYIIEEQSKVNTLEDIQNTKTIKDKIYKL